MFHGREILEFNMLSINVNSLNLILIKYIYVELALGLGAFNPLTYNYGYSP